MNGWHRFGLLLICCVLIMILFPQYGHAGWPFIGLVILMWTGAILIMAFLTNIFALDRMAWFNKVVTLAFLIGFLYTLLWYFPQSDRVSPINKLKHGEYPSMQDVKQGLKKLTFNFDFVRRNVHRSENFVNQEAPYSGAVKRTRETVQKLQQRVNDEIEIGFEKEQE